jgi:hypothetical protein
MSDLNYAQENVRVISRPNWGAIWAGMFTFVAIWSVFATLGSGIFASSASTGAASPTAGMNLGMAVWSVILTIIAMFVAGRVTAQLAGITNSRDGMLHGMVMFGLSIAAVLLIGAIGGSAFGRTELAGITHNSYLLGVSADLGWGLFVSLFLGWLAAMGGASTAHRELSHTAVQQQHVRA